MAICSFLGHSEVYDRNMAQRAEEAVLGLAEREEELHFLFPAHQKNPFHLACWQGVQAAKEKFPEKKFFVQLMVAEGEESFFETWIKERGLPIDRVIAPVRQPSDRSKLGRGFIAMLRERARWAVQHSDYMICYLYEEFESPKTNLYKYAQKRNVQLIQIANGNIQERIADEIKKRSAQEQFALEQRRMGKTYQEIAQLMNLQCHKARVMIQTANWEIEQEICNNPI